MITLKADMNSPVQENYLGLGAIYHPFAGMPDDAGRVYTEEQCEMEAARAAYIRVKVVRGYYSWYAWDKDTNTWDWDNERMTVVYKWLERMKKAGITVVLNTGWWNIGDLMGNYHAGPCPFYVEGDWDKTIQNYADWVSANVEEIIIKRGFTNVKYFALFTEPNECPLREFPNEEVRKNYRESWYKSAKAVHDTLVRNGLRDKIKLLGPQEGQANRPWFTEWALSMGCGEWLDGISMHNYLQFNSCPKTDAHSGSKAVIFPFAGARLQQDVTLKKNTDYTVSVWVKSKKNIPVSEDSSVVFGLFSEGSFWHYFTHYCERSDSVFTMTVPANEIEEDWKKFEFTFNSGEHEKLTAGLFSNMKRADGIKDSLWNGLPFLLANGLSLYCDDFNLRETETGKELLLDPSFECSNYWNVLWGRYLCTDAYENWLGMEKDAIRILPQHLKSHYWHDEYNVSFDEKSDPEHGVYMSLGQVAQMNGGGKCSFMWTLFDQQWPNNHTNSPDAFEDGVHIHGIAPVLNKTLVPHPTYYSWGLVSRYTGGEGTKTYEGINLSDEKVAMNVNALPDGNYTITVVNYGRKELDVALRFNTCFGRDFNRHTYNSATIVPDETATLPGIDKVFEGVTDTIEDTLAPMSVVVYTTLND
ncbi:MAG: hypothetical protein IJ426_05015 [Clostridia bacterium]|nr:hypothetical protein [Clostridia bacterium]